MRRKIKRVTDNICNLFKSSQVYLNGYFANLRNWLFDFITAIEGENAAAYGLLINEISSFIKLLAAIISSKEGKKEIELNDIKKAAIRFFRIFIDYNFLPITIA